MKQNILMLFFLFVGTVGSFVRGPFYGILIYYLFAVLRPQYLWKWALTLDIRWSYYVALAALGALLLTKPSAKPANYSKYGNTAIIFFAIWITISYVFAINRDVASITYNEYVKIFLMFFVSTIVLREFYQIELLYIIALASLGYIAIELNSLYFFSGRLDIYHLGYGGLDNNGAGLMIAMGVPMAYFLWDGSNKWWRWIPVALIPFIIHAVLMSYSRGAMISLLVSSPLFVIRSHNKKAMIVAILAFILLVPALAGNEVRSRFFTVNDYNQDGSANLRFQSWKAAIHIAEDYPIFGVGVRNADLLSYQYGTDMPGRTIHSIYLQIAADCGFPGLAIYILVLLIAWRNLRGFQKKYGRSSEHRLPYSISCGIEGAMVVFCVGAAFLSLEVFELPYLLILLAFQLPGAVENSAPLPSIPEP